MRHVETNAVTEVTTIATNASGEANKALVRRVIDEVVNQRNYEALQETHASGFVLQSPLAPGVVTGREAYEAALRGTFEVFPDLTVRIDDLLTQAELVAYSISFTGTHEGEIMGAPATGKTVSWGGISLGQIDDGKFAELRGYHDTLGLLRQLGVSEVPSE